MACEASLTFATTMVVKLMKFTVRVLFFAMVLVSSAIVLWRQANTVSVKVTNQTGRQIEVEIVQAGNHSIHHRQSRHLENGECQAFKLYTRSLERSVVRVFDESGKTGKFRRPLGVLGFFRTESYTIGDDFLRVNNDTTGFIESPFQDPPL